MLSLRLYCLCLLLIQPNVIGGVTFPPSVQDHAVKAGLATTTERETAPTTPHGLLPGPTHRTNALSPLHRRGDGIHVLNNGWRMKFLRIDSGFPVAIASALLEQFYERVLEHVYKFTTTVAPLKVLWLYVHDLYLEFSCDSTEVSWDLIKAFVTAMLDATRRGFTGKFMAVMFHDPTATVVNIALRILGPADSSDSTKTTVGSRMH